MKLLDILPHPSYDVRPRIGKVLSKNTFVAMIRLLIWDVLSKFLCVFTYDTVCLAGGILAARLRVITETSIIGNLISMLNYCA